MAAERGAPTLAVASNLNFAMPEIAAVFKARTGRDVRVVYGASGHLARQIREGAPFEVFLAADEQSPVFVAQAGRSEGEGVVYAVGRLTLFVPDGSSLPAGLTLETLASALRAGHVKRIALANPDLAPYGAATREMLERRGLWAPVRARAVLGENVSQTAQFALAGGADVAFLPLSIAVAPILAKRGTWTLIPAAEHAPIRQRMILVRGARETARAFFDFMQGPEASAILARYGFEVPGGR